MTNMKTILKHELTTWKLWEISWLIFCILSITFLSLYWNDILIGIISAVSGITYVVCIGKGNISAYFFGMINCVLYSMISFEATLYGEVLLNAGYYLPMMFVGVFLWKKNINQVTYEKGKTSLWTKYVMAGFGGTYGEGESAQQMEADVAGYVKYMEDNGVTTLEGIYTNAYSLM